MSLHSHRATSPQSQNNLIHELRLSCTSGPIQWESSPWWMMAVVAFLDARPRTDSLYYRHSAVGLMVHAFHSRACAGQGILCRTGWVREKRRWCYWHGGHRYHSIHKLCCSSCLDITVAVIMGCIVCHAWIIEQAMTTRVAELFLALDLATLESDTAAISPCNRLSSQYVSYASVLNPIKTSQQKTTIRITSNFVF